MPTSSGRRATDFRFQARGRSTARSPGDRLTNSWWRVMANAAPRWNSGCRPRGRKQAALSSGWSMDHTPSDLIVVDDNSMLPLGRPTITSALDEHTRCPMGFYAGFEPPSCLSVMRCLKHAILPKTYVQREFPSVKNRWECYGVPELVVVDNPPEFHSSHFRAGMSCRSVRTSNTRRFSCPGTRASLNDFRAR